MGHLRELEEHIVYDYAVKGIPTSRLSKNGDDLSSHYSLTANEVLNILRDNGVDTSRTPGSRGKGKDCGRFPTLTKQDITDYFNVRQKRACSLETYYREHFGDPDAPTKSYNSNPPKYASIGGGFESDGTLNDEDYDYDYNYAQPWNNGSLTDNLNTSNLGESNNTSSFGGENNMRAPIRDRSQEYNNNSDGSHDGLDILFQWIGIITVFYWMIRGGMWIWSLIVSVIHFIF